VEALIRDRSRLLVGGAFIAVALIVLIIGYGNIRDETAVPIQMPYVLSGGVGALLLGGVGMVIMRSQDDRAILDRLNEVEASNEELRERLDYLTQLLETALLPDDVVIATREGTRTATTR
jgi:hypothetical protein